MNIAWGDLGLVLLVGLAAGAGVVAVFALGVAALAGPSESTAEPAAGLRRLVGYACFAVCAAVVGYGIYLAIPNLHRLF
jgi:hypothetical protein